MYYKLYTYKYYISIKITLKVGNSIRAHCIHMQTKLFSLALLWIPEETGLLVIEIGCVMANEGLKELTSWP